MIDINLRFFFVCGLDLIWFIPLLMNIRHGFTADHTFLQGNMFSTVFNRRFSKNNNKTAAQREYKLNHKAFLDTKEQQERKQPAKEGRKDSYCRLFPLFFFPFARHANEHALYCVSVLILISSRCISTLVPLL